VRRSSRVGLMAFSTTGNEARDRNCNTSSRDRGKTTAGVGTPCSWASRNTSRLSVRARTTRGDGRGNRNRGVSSSACSATSTAAASVVGISTAGPTRFPKSSRKINVSATGACSQSHTCALRQ